MLFLHLFESSIDRVSVICKLAIKWYLMRMCASWLCSFNYQKIRFCANLLVAFYADQRINRFRKKWNIGIKNCLTTCIGKDMATRLIEVKMSTFFNSFDRRFEVKAIVNSQKDIAIRQSEVEMSTPFISFDGRFKITANVNSQRRFQYESGNGKCQHFLWGINPHIQTGLLFSLSEASNTGEVIYDSMR